METLVTMETLTTTECMKILKVTRPTLLKLIKEKKLKAFRVGPAYRVQREELERFIRGEVDEPKAAAR
jgi:excisionase family DNA binding protein